MTAFAQHFAFEFKTGLRNPNQLLLNYLFPLGFYALLGLVMTQINPGFTETMVPAMVVFAIMASTILGPPVVGGVAGSGHLPQLQDQRRPGPLNSDHSRNDDDLSRPDYLQFSSSSPGRLFKGIAPVHWGAFVPWL